MNPSRNPEKSQNQKGQPLLGLLLISLAESKVASRYDADLTTADSRQSTALWPVVFKGFRVQGLGFIKV